MKDRPLTDPLICHVASFEQAQDLVSFEDNGAQEVFRVLAKNFWPGPLTLVCPKSTKVPSIVTANSEFVGVRCPDHPVALRMIEEAGTAIAAPSANPFCRISPTTAEHVFQYFSASDLQILDGGPCEVGVESTVCKIVSGSELQIIRKGGVVKHQIEDIANLAGLKLMVQYSGNSLGVVSDESKEGPGQFPRHYSPGVPTKILSLPVTTTVTHQSSTLPLANSYVLDILNLLPARYIPLCGNYRQLVDTFEDSTPCWNCILKTLYEALLEGEKWVLERMKRGDSELLECSVLIIKFEKEGLQQIATTVWDRLERSAGGAYI
eukprot:Filipodium_phascolosomae@DN835_c0_g1_i1.p1